MEADDPPAGESVAALFARWRDIEAARAAKDGDGPFDRSDPLMTAQIVVMRRLMRRRAKTLEEIHLKMTVWRGFVLDGAAADEAGRPGDALACSICEDFAAMVRENAPGA